MLTFVIETNFKVYEQLQKLGLCLSHSKTINLVDILGKYYDLDVKERKSAAELALNSTTIQVL